MRLSRSNTILGWSVVAASLAVLFRRVWLMELDSFEFDDSFMFIRYAENIIAGSGYTWNAGDPAIFGCTSILFTYIIAAVKFIFGGVASNSWILVGTALFFGLAFLAEIQGGMFQTAKSAQLKNRLVLALLTVPFLTLPLILGFHISTGMETTLSLFLHTGFIYSVIRYGASGRKDWKWLLTAGMTTYLIYLVRPDNALAALIFPLLYLSSIRKYKHIPFLVAVAAGFVLLDGMVKLAVFGDLLPLSFYTKKSGFTEGYTAKYFWNPVKYITQFTAYLMPYILMIFIFVRKKHALMLASFLLPLAATFLYYFTFDQIMGFNARLYFPFVPYIVIPALLILDDFLAGNKEDRQLLWKTEVLFRKFLFLLLFLFLSVYSKYRFINMYESYAIREGNKNAIAIPGLEERKYNRELSIKKISDLLKEYPGDLVFAATEHGFISGDNPDKRILDLSGLHNYTIAKKGFTSQILENEHPDLIWMPHQDLTVLHHQVRTSAYFQENYDYISNIYAFGIAVHRNSPYFEELKAAIK